MYFFLQAGKNGRDSFDLDIEIVRESLDRQKYVHQYQMASLGELPNMLASGQSGDSIWRFGLRNAIPVGTLQYVGQFLKIIHGITRMNPIEVPEVLRQERFLKRQYSICPLSGIPRAGRHFIKYVSELKVFSCTGDVSHLYDNPDFVLKDGLYQVSEEVEILSEYRCFVHNDKLVAVQNYDGDCSVFPDASLIRAMIGNYMRDPGRPQAYTADIAVIKDRGTVILEVHPWVSVGLYGYLFGNDLPYCYRDGLQYYLDDNRESQPWSSE